LHRALHLAIFAELITAVSLIVALTGFITRRTRPWLVGVAITLAMLIIACDYSCRIVDLNLTTSAASIAFGLADLKSIPECVISARTLSTASSAVVRRSKKGDAGTRPVGSSSP
jgi:hypothetical protein